MNANKIAVIDQGKILEQGSHNELIQKGGVYAKLVQKQLQKMNNTLKEDELIDTSTNNNNENQQKHDDIIDTLMQ